MYSFCLCFAHPLLDRRSKRAVSGASLRVVKLFGFTAWSVTRRRGHSKTPANTFPSSHITSQWSITAWCPTRQTSVQSATLLESCCAQNYIGFAYVHNAIFPHPTNAWQVLYKATCHIPHATPLAWFPAAATGYAAEEEEEEVAAGGKFALFSSITSNLDQLGNQHVN